MQKKLILLFIIVLLAFVGLSVRLFLINKENGEQYKRQVLSQQKYNSITIPYKRGTIVDAKGTTLAISEKVYSLIIDSQAMQEKEEYVIATMTALKQCFQFDETKIRKYMQDNPSSRYYVVLKNLSYDEISGFVELTNDTENNPDIKGVWFEESYKRKYPYDTLACDVIGFADADGSGQYGLEQYYNDLLSGNNGREFGYLNTDSTLERTTKPAEHGKTIVSSIDVNIQSIVERKIFEYNEKYRDDFREGAGSKNTAVIVMNPKTGKLFAMASYPVFDLNNPQDLSVSKLFSEEEMNAMEQDTYMKHVNEVWQNFCIQSTFEPGSTAKPFTLATGLESGKLLGNEVYECVGYLQVGQFKIHCHNRLGHAPVSLSESLENSCNVAFMKMGAAIGKEELLKFQNMFHLGLKTNIDLTGEARTELLVFNENTMNQTELATASFGQGYNVTMIQMAAAFSSLINGGYYYEPSMVNKILSSDGATIQNVEPRLLKQTISAETSQKMIDYCNGVVTDGTGKTARPAGYTMGGKTGTAEKVPRNQGNYVVSFIGYAPAKDPEVLIYVVIDEPNAAKQQDSTRHATILCNEIMTEVLPYLNIFMTEELSEEEKEKLDDIYKPSTTPEEGNEDENEDKNEDENNEEDNKNEDDQKNEEDNKQPDIKYDPETGYAIDPVTGDLLDPETGIPIDPNVSFMSPNATN